VPESVKDPVIKETAGALASGLSTFLTAALVSSIGDRDESAVGDLIKARLRAHYNRQVPPGTRRVHLVVAGSPLEQFLQSDFYAGLSGWDRDTRIARARGIKRSL
ncbi:MAG: hypothetical protein ACRDZW_03125, partial [Acidimicrobiales bacterium]